MNPYQNLFLNKYAIANVAQECALSLNLNYDLFESFISFLSIFILSVLIHHSNLS